MGIIAVNAGSASGFDKAICHWRVKFDFLAPPVAVRTHKTQSLECGSSGGWVLSLKKESREISPSRLKNQTQDTNKMIIARPKAETRQVSKPPQHAKPPVCHRCGEPAPKRGRMSASIEDDSGKVRKLYLCRLCIAALSSWHALYRHAEASEREETRRRFTERRPSYRKEAA